MTTQELLRQLWAITQASGPTSRAAREMVSRHADNAAFVRGAMMLVSIARRVQSKRPG